MDLFNKLLHSITWGIAICVDAIYQAFAYIAGIGQMTDNTENAGQNIIGNDFLSQLMNVNFGSGINFNTIYLGFMSIGFMLLVVSLIIAIIKTLINKEDEIKSRKLVYQKAGASVLYMVVAPFLFMVIIWGTSVIITTITRIMASSYGSENISIADTILASAYNGNVTLEKKWLDYNDYGSFKQGLMDAGGNLIFYNYWLALLGGGCTLVGLLMVSFTVVERIIHTIFLYLISPFVFAKTPLDQGKSFEQWRDLLMSKLFSLAGIIICMYLFFTLVGIINTMQSANGVVKLLFMIGGVFTFTKAGTLVSHLISQGSGNFEGMSQATSMGMLNSGLRMVEHTAMGIGRGALMGIGSGTGQAVKGIRGAKAGANALGKVGANALAGAKAVEGQAVKSISGAEEMGLGEASQNMAMMNMATQGGLSNSSTPYYMGASGMLGYMAGRALTKGVSSISNAVHNVGQSKPIISAKAKMGSMTNKFEAKHPTTSAIMSAPVILTRAIRYQHQGKKQAKIERTRELNSSLLERQASRKAEKQDFYNSNIALGKASFAEKERQKEDKKNKKGGKSE